MRIRGRGNRWYQVQAVANVQCLKDDYSELLKSYNGYVVKSLDDLKNTNNKNIFFIIETQVYYVVTHQTLNDAMEELMKKHKADNE